MDIVIGKSAGFCFGVKKAVEGANKEINNKSMYCLGELIHNEAIMESLKKKGLIEVDKIEDVPQDEKMIIRAHGVSPEIYEIAKERNISLIDLTCPKVARIHELAQEFMKKNYYIILVAENKHPETIGTKGFCGKKSSIVECLDDVEHVIRDFKESKLDKVAIIVQTTFSIGKFKTIENKIRSLLKCQVEVVNTICNATAIRQQETEDLSKQVDFMIIIGGKNSANTKRLYEISLKNCKNSILIQNKNDDILKEMLNNNNFSKIGIMAGASTPKECIDEVVKFLKNNS